MTDKIIEFGFTRSDGNTYSFKVGKDCHSIEFETIDYGEYGVRFVVAFDNDKKRLAQAPDYKCDYILFVGWDS